MTFTDIWEIQDDQGTIYSGTEQEMKTLFYGIYGERHLHYDLKHPEWNIKWVGNLRLVQLHDIIT